MIFSYFFLQRTTFWALSLGKICSVDDHLVLSTLNPEQGSQERVRRAMWVSSHFAFNLFSQPRFKKKKNVCVQHFQSYWLIWQKKEIQMPGGIGRGKKKKKKTGGGKRYRKEGEVGEACHISSSYKKPILRIKKEEAMTFTSKNRALEIEQFLKYNSHQRVLTITLFCFFNKWLCCNSVKLKVLSKIGMNLYGKARGKTSETSMFKYTNKSKAEL